MHSLSEIPFDTLSLILQFCSKKALKTFIFTSKEIYQTFRELRKENLEELRLWYLNKQPFERKIDSRLIEPFKQFSNSPFPKIKNFQEFDKSFEEICKPEGIGKYMIEVAFEMNKKMKQKFVVAGGSLMSVLMNKDHFKLEYDPNETEFIPKRPPPDIDIFLIENGCNSEDSEKIIKEWFTKVEKIYFQKYPQNALSAKKSYQEALENNEKVERDSDIFQVDAENEFVICRDINNTISIVPVKHRKIQIILRKVISVEQLLLFFDLDCVRFAFDGERLLTTREGIRSFKIKKNIVQNIHKYNGMYFERAIQYGYRGVDTTFVDLHPLEHLDENFNQTKNVKMTFAHENRDKTDGEGYYVVSPFLRHQEFLAMYFLGHRDFEDFTFQGTICLSFSELFKLNAEDCFTEEYRDNHLFNKYLISRCYICGKYQQLHHPYADPNDYDPEEYEEGEEEISDEESRKFRFDIKRDNFCLDCLKFNDKNRNAFKGKRAIVTGGRIKIGFAVALKLLRAGCSVIVTTRFPHDALMRYQKETGKFDYFINLKDFDSFKDLLMIYPLDLKNTELLLIFTNYINKNFNKIDYLINNAAQTVRRPLYFYKNLIEKEEGLKQIKDSQDIKDSSVTSLILEKSLIQKSIEVTKSNQIKDEKSTGIYLDRSDEFGEPLDKREKNSWNTTLEEVNPIEIMEVQMINNIAPTLLTSNLISVMSKRNSISDDGFSYIINVTSDEGQFETFYKSKYHSHTNISKAALNMLTRTSASLYAQQGILMNSVDPGWISSMIPSFKKPILDCDDGASRILHPIFTDYQKYGKLLKNYREIKW